MATLATARATATPEPTLPTALDVSIAHATDHDHPHTVATAKDSVPRDTAPFRAKWATEEASEAERVATAILTTRATVLLRRASVPAMVDPAMVPMALAPRMDTNLLKATEAAAPCWAIVDSLCLTRRRMPPRSIASLQELPLVMANLTHTARRSLVMASTPRSLTVGLSNPSPRRGLLVLTTRSQLMAAMAPSQLATMAKHPLHMESFTKLTPSHLLHTANLLHLPSTTNFPEPTVTALKLAHTANLLAHTANLLALTVRSQQAPLTAATGHTANNLVSMANLLVTHTPASPLAYLMANPVAYLTVSQQACLTVSLPV